MKFISIFPTISTNLNSFGLEKNLPDNFIDEKLYKPSSKTKILQSA